MTKLLKPVQRLLIGMIILLMVVVASSLAEELTLTTIIAPTSPENSYLFVSDTFGEQLVVTESTGQPRSEWGTYYQYTWIAPKTGDILVKWYNPGVYVDIPIVADSRGNFGLSIFLDGNYGSMAALRFITMVYRFAGGYVQYPPVTEVFSVTEGVAYSIDLKYFAQSFDNLRVTFAQRGGVIGIEYVAYNPHPIVY